MLDPDDLESQYSRELQEIPEHKLPAESKAELIAAYSDRDRDLEVLRSLLQHQSLLVVRNTFRQATWRTLEDMLSLFSGQEARLGIGRLFGAYDRFPVNVSYERKESLARLLGGLEDPLMMATLCSHSPILDENWPSRKSVAHIIRLMQIVTRPEDRQSGIDITFFSDLMERATPSLSEASYNTEGDSEHDILLMNLMRVSLGHRSVKRFVDVLNAILLVWPKVHSVQTLMRWLAHYADDMSSHLVMALSKHNETLHKRMLRNRIALHAKLSTVQDQTTDVVATQCSICMTNVRAILFDPCTHCCTCVSCFLRISESSGQLQCPICKAPIQSARPVLLP